MEHIAVTFIISMTSRTIIEILMMITMVKRKFAGKESYNFNNVLLTVGFSFTIQMIFLKLEIGTERVLSLRMY